MSPFVIRSASSIYTRIGFSPLKISENAMQKVAHVFSAFITIFK